MYADEFRVVCRPVTDIIAGQNRVGDSDMLCYANERNTYLPRKVQAKACHKWVAKLKPKGINSVAIL